MKSEYARCEDCGILRNLDIAKDCPICIFKVQSKKELHLLKNRCKKCDKPQSRGDICLQCRIKLLRCKYCGIKITGGKTCSVCRQKALSNTWIKKRQ